MAVAHDAASDVGSTKTGNFSWTHTPVGTPKGIVVFLMELAASADPFTGVTYGGVPMDEVASGFAQDTAGEPLCCKAYFLGDSIPTGAQTVSVSAAGGLSAVGVAASVTAGNDTEVLGVVKDEGDGTLSEKSISDGSTGVDSLRFGGIATGLNSPPSVGANSTSLFALDDGAVCAAVVRETTAGQGSRSVGFSEAGSDDRAAVYFVVREVHIPGAELPATLDPSSYAISVDFQSAGDTVGY